MKILVAHNFYRSVNPSGENAAVRSTVDALTSAGVTTQLLGWNSDDLAAASAAERLRQAVRMVHARAPGDLAAQVARFRPDVVQLHNPVPRLAPDELRAIRRSGTPVVHVIHNYRHSCLAGSHRRAGNGCVECIGARWSRGAGIRHRCYRGSLAQSALLALSETIHHRLWRDLDGYVAISDHVRRQLVSVGFPAEAITVVPDPVPGPPPRVPGPRQDVLFAGRLAPEKGIGLLLDAWLLLDEAERRGRVLHVAGAGPEAAAVASSAKRHPSITFHGQLDREGLHRVGSRCSVTVVPSRWEEPFGLVAVEALAAGRGIVVTDRGALPEIATDPTCSWQSSPDARALAAVLREALRQDPERVEEAARRHWHRHYRPSVVGRLHRDQLASVLAGSRTSSRQEVRHG